MRYLIISLLLISYSALQAQPLPLLPQHIQYSRDTHHAPILSHNEKFVLEIIGMNARISDLRTQEVVKNILLSPSWLREYSFSPNDSLLYVLASDSSTSQRKFLSNGPSYLIARLELRTVNWRTGEERRPWSGRTVSYNEVLPHFSADGKHIIKLDESMYRKWRVSDGALIDSIGEEPSQVAYTIRIDRNTIQQRTYISNLLSTDETGDIILQWLGKSKSLNLSQRFKQRIINDQIVNDSIQLLTLYDNGIYSYNINQDKAEKVRPLNYATSSAILTNDGLFLQTQHDWQDQFIDSLQRWDTLMVTSAKDTSIKRFLIPFGTILCKLSSSSNIFFLTDYSRIIGLYNNLTKQYVSYDTLFKHIINAHFITTSYGPAIALERSIDRDSKKTIISIIDTILQSSRNYETVGNPVAASIGIPQSRILNHKQYLTADNTIVKRMSLRSQHIIDSFVSFANNVALIESLPDNQGFLAVDFSKRLHLWRLKDHTLRAVYSLPQEPFFGLVVSPNGRYLLLPTNNLIHVFDVQNGSVVKDYSIPFASIAQITFSSDTSKMLILSANSDVGIFQTPLEWINDPRISVATMHQQVFPLTFYIPKESTPAYDSSGNKYLPLRTSVTLELLDAHKHLITTVLRGALHTGKWHTWEWDATQLSEGVYYQRTTIDGHISYQKHVRTR